MTKTLSGGLLVVGFFLSGGFVFVPAVYAIDVEKEIRERAQQYGEEFVDDYIGDFGEAVGRGARGTSATDGANAGTGVQGGAAARDVTKDPGGFLSQLFTLVIGLAGVLAVLKIVLAGFQYLTARDNPSAIEAAKGKIQAAVFGLILALGSYAILYTINPKLVELNLGLEVLDPRGQIISTSGTYCFDAASLSATQRCHNGLDACEDAAVTYAANETKKTGTVIPTPECKPGSTTSELVKEDIGARTMCKYIPDAGGPNRPSLTCHITEEMCRVGASLPGIECYKIGEIRNPTTATAVERGFTCSSCAKIPTGIDVKENACAVRDSGSCLVRRTLATNLGSLNLTYPSQGQWRVTEAWPPTVAHSNLCHYQATCVDVGLTGEGSAALIKKFIDEAKKQKLHPIYEVKTKSECETLLAQGIPRGNIQVVSAITAPHFSVYSEPSSGSGCN